MLPDAPAFLMIALTAASAVAAEPNDQRARARELGLVVGSLQPGPLNAITDVAGVRVGHTTVISGDRVRTGVTAILPHGGNLFQQKAPAAIHTYNAFGKLAGSTQVDELGNIETPIVLTNTLSVGRAMSAVVRYTLALPGNEQVRSVNAVVGETNDGFLNDIRGMHVTEQHVIDAIRAAQSGPVAEGSVGAGCGTRAFGYKGGIGTASRRSPSIGNARFTVGVLVQANFGWELNLAGVPFQPASRQQPSGSAPQPTEDGSCMIVIATDAPLSCRNLERLARRSFAGMARTRSVMSNGSGDFAIAFSTAYRIPYRSPQQTVPVPPLLTNDAMSAMFRAVEEATQEAIYNALFMATTVRGRDGNTARAIPLGRVRELLKDR